MLKYTFQKIFTGIEISETSINVAQIEKEGAGWRLVHSKTVPFPENTLKLSYKKNNIADSDRFRKTIGEALQDSIGKVSSIGLSIPNDIVKISIKKYEELPDSESETEKMIAWSIEKLLRFPEKSTKITYEMIEQNAQNEKWLLIAIGIRDVIKEYELNLKELKIFPKVIRPSGINQFNFFSRALPEKGINAFIGLYENYFTFLVFEDDKLIFFHGVKKGFSNLHFFQDVDMTMQHFLNAYPDKEVEKLYIGSQVAFHKELEEVFRNLSDMDIIIMDESDLIETNSNTKDKSQREQISYFVSAIGAAQSLLQ
ncbi:MAG: hypothetical protein JRI91_07685 [Deltaproteobacteria bacterium]|nr:hypothetical protein [Deltaproteobacteria bacterium]